METTAVPENNLLEENELVELQSLSFSFFDGMNIPLNETKLADIIQENSTGIEKAVKSKSQECDSQDEEEQEEYVKDVTYESENFYIQKNPYSPKKDYEIIEHIKPKEEEAEKSFLWK
jgi:hypothetical protein